jgi:methionine synthase II (cobalamin-independent)
MLGTGRYGAGFTAVSLDQDLLTGADLDVLAGAVEAGAELWLGCLPTASGQVPGVDQVRTRVLRLADRLGVGDRLADRLVLTPACGLAGHTPAAASRVFEVLARAAGQVGEELGGPR